MNVLHYGPNPRIGTPPLALFPRGLDPARFNQRLAARRGWVLSSRNSGCDCLLEMKLGFFTELVAPFAENQEGKPRLEFRDHEDLSAGRPRTHELPDVSRPLLDTLRGPPSMHGFKRERKDL